MRIDGHDVRDLKLADLRTQFSIVLQEPLLFSGTIADQHQLRKAGRHRGGGDRGGEGGERARLHLGASPTATTRCSGSGARRLRAASASGSQSPGPFSATPRS